MDSQATPIATCEIKRDDHRKEGKHRPGWQRKGSEGQGWIHLDLVNFHAGTFRAAAFAYCDSPGRWAKSYAFNANGDMRGMANMRILVTGGAGFLGSHLAERLLA